MHAKYREGTSSRKLCEGITFAPLCACHAAGKEEEIAVVAETQPEEPPAVVAATPQDGVFATPLLLRLSPSSRPVYYPLSGECAVRHFGFVATSRFPQPHGIAPIRKCLKNPHWKYRKRIPLIFGMHEKSPRSKKFSGVGTSAYVCMHRLSCEIRPGGPSQHRAGGHGLFLKDGLVTGEGRAKCSPPRLADATGSSIALLAHVACASRRSRAHAHLGRCACSRE